MFPNWIFSLAPTHNFFLMRFLGNILFNFYERPLPCRLPSRCGSPSHHPPGGIHFRWRGVPRTGTSGCAGSAASSPCCRAPASSASWRAHSPPSPRFDLLQPKQRRHSEICEWVSQLFIIFSGYHAYNNLETYFHKGLLLFGSVVDPHHVNADPDADTDFYLMRIRNRIKILASKQRLKPMKKW